MDDLDAKAVSLTTFIFKVPTYKRLLLYLIVWSFFAGIAKHAIEGLGGAVSLSDAFFFGGSNGVIFFGLPALVAALLAASILSRQAFKQSLKYFLFISLLSTVLYSLLFCAAVFVEKGMPMGASFFANDYLVVIASALALVIWFVSLLVPLDYNAFKAFFVSLVHPLLMLSFFVIGKYAYAPFESMAGFSLLLGIKFVVAAGILLLALWSVFVIINAPAKRNFGISTVQAATFFFAQWIKGGKGLEEVLSEVGSEVETNLSTVIFRAKGRAKALFVVPYVHYGPFGNLGGSEFPYLLGRDLGRKFGTAAFVFHATANHDFNPVFSSSHLHVEKEFEQLVENAPARDFRGRACFATAKSGSATLFGLCIGKKDGAFIALSRHPLSTEDIEPSLGLALSAKAQSKGFKSAVLVDMHNSKTSGRLIETGSREFYEYFDALDSLSYSEDGPLWMGVSEKRLPQFTLDQGVGRAGMKLAVFKIGKKKACLILVDANNALPTFRSHLAEALQEYGFEFVDVMTTDTHSVNSINGVHNPLGVHVKPHDLLPVIRQAIAEAEGNLEQVSACVQSARIRIRVLGEKRSSELLSTVNSIVSVVKILAPLIFLLSLALSAVILLAVSRYFAP
ncbi:MAG: DUF2070 family protein [Candidatus Micrarchaeia archaeon]|jgi:putative membrane protein